MKALSVGAYALSALLIVGFFSCSGGDRFGDADFVVTTPSIYIQHIGPSFSLVPPLIIYSLEKPTRAELDWILVDRAYKNNATYLSINDQNLKALVSEVSKVLERTEDFDGLPHFGMFRIIVSPADGCWSYENLRSKETIVLGNMMCRKMAKEEMGIIIDLLENNAEKSDARELGEWAKGLRRIIESKPK